GAPKGTPVEIVDRLNTAMNESLADPKLKARLADLGATVLTGSSAELGKLIADETEKWAKGIEFAKIKAEGAAPTFYKYRCPSAGPALIERLKRRFVILTSREEA